jgi:FHS family L-fucose permease-like MFS transporter
MTHPTESAVSAPVSRPSFLRATPVFLAFLTMGFGDAVGPFVGLARQDFHLSNFAAQLIAFTGFIMFGILSVPLSVYQDRKGKKFILVLGLCVMLFGLLVATVAGLTAFPGLLAMVLLLGAGATTLQVAGNPLMRDVSGEGKYSRNLSLAQFVKAIGSLSGPLIPVIAARAFGASWRVIFPVYSGAVLIALVLAVALLPRGSQNSSQKTASLHSCLALLRNGYVAMMVLAIFLYVGAEVSVSSSIPLYLKDRYGVDVASTGLLGTGLFFAALTIGRFSGGVVLNWIKPKTFYVTTCLLSIVGLLGLFVPSEPVVAVSFFVIGLGFANIFPLVFSIAVDSRPQDINPLSGLMVMAIVGGAFLPPLMGLLADASHSVQAGFLVPLAAILYITWAAWANVGKSATVR